MKQLILRNKNFHARSGHRPIARIVLTMMIIFLGIAVAGLTHAQSGDESITSPDTTGDVGWDGSMVLDSNGFPVVSYWDLTNRDLKILHCNDPNCTGGDESITSPDTAGLVGEYSSLTLDSNGFPVVSYYDFTNRDLKILHCNDPNCTGGDESITSPDTTGDVGREGSLALDSNGFPVVSYWDTTNRDLKILHCNDPNCTGGDESITAPDTVGDVGRETSLGLDSNGFPVVGYRDVTNDDLKILHCNDPNCTGGGESIVSVTNGGDYSSLALDSNGFPVISYQNHGDLKLLHCNDPNCTGGDESITAPDTDGDVGSYTSLALDSNGYPVVSYYDFTNDDLKLLHCNDPNCTGGDESITAPDTGEYVGYTTSLALDSNGYPVVSYYDDSNFDLKLLHCNDPNCTTAPVAEDDTYTTDEDTAATIDVLANDSDVDGGSLTVTSVTSPSNGTAVINPDNSVTYTPTVNFNGSDIFSYTIEDGNSGSDTAAVNITVNPVNDVPLAIDDEVSTPQDAAITVDVLANDSDIEGDVLSVTNVTAPTNGTAIINPDHSVTYTSAPGFVGVDSFTYTIADGAGDVATATVVVVVEEPLIIECALYPIALAQNTLDGVNPGDPVSDILNGDQPGNFAWLTWSGNPNVPTLAKNLTPPGNVDTYVNPYDASDHLVTLGDWVQGRPGVVNAKKVKDALDILVGQEIIVPVWDESEGQSNNANYHVSDFVQVRITAYDLSGQNLISVEFLGYVNCQ